jgi:hypothetical protein
MKYIFLTLSCIAACLFSFGQEKYDSLVYSLAYTVLNRTQEVGVGGDAGTPAEVIAFNIIYRSTSPGKRFKDVYQRSDIPGKFYCILGLFLVKDPEYEKFKNSFISSKIENGIFFRAGCIGMKYEDLGRLLDIWINGFATKVWFTEALIIK